MNPTIEDHYIVEYRGFTYRFTPSGSPIESEAEAIKIAAELVRKDGRKAIVYKPVATLEGGEPRQWNLGEGT